MASPTEGSQPSDTESSSAFHSFGYAATVQTILLVGALQGLTIPVWWGAVANARGYDIVTFGTMQTINAAVGVVVGSWLVVYLQKLDRRKIMVACGLIGSAVEIATIFAVDKYAFFAVRSLGAAATGVAGILGLVYLSYTREPSKTFGWYTTLQAAIQALGLYTIPVIAKGFGVFGLQLSLASVGIIVAMLSLTLPKHLPMQVQQNTDSLWTSLKSIPWLAAIPALLAFLSFGFYTSDFFGYSERFGNARGLDPERIGLILSLTMAAGIPASLFVSWLGDRIGKVIPVMIGGVAGLVATLLLLIPEFGEIGYWIALMVFSLVWSFVYPYLLALFGEVDPVGRLLVATQPIREAVRTGLTAMLTVATLYYGLDAAAWCAAVAVVACPLFVAIALAVNERHKLRAASQSGGATVAV